MTTPDQHNGRPLRVLHVLGNLGRGGAETWFAQLVQHFDRREIQTDVLVNGQPDGANRAAVDRAGCRVFVCGSPSNPLRYRRHFLKVLRDHGPYDAVHGHLWLFNGFLMKLAREGGVPVRIAHSRSSSDGQRLTLVRRAYLALMRHWLAIHASHRLAVTKQSALATFGPRYGDSQHCSVLTGIDTSPFRSPADAGGIRRSLGISESKAIVGHVGSFRRVKNHEFLLEVGFALVRRRPEVLFLLVGDGLLREEMVRRVREVGLADHFLFLGDRADVPRLMLGAMDAFCLPSLYEGMPRVLLEAQAAALPCIASDRITREAGVCSALVRFLGLNEPAEAWCDALENALDSRGAVPGAAALQALEARGLTIESNARTLINLYSRLHNECRQHT